MPSDIAIAVQTSCVHLAALEEVNMEQRRRLGALRRSVDMYRSRLGLSFEQRTGGQNCPVKAATGAIIYGILEMQAGFGRGFGKDLCLPCCGLAEGKG